MFSGIVFVLEINPEKKEKKLSYLTGPSPKAQPSLPPPAAGPAAARAGPIGARIAPPAWAEAAAASLGRRARARAPYKGGPNPPTARRLLRPSVAQPRRHLQSAAALPCPSQSADDAADRCSIRNDGTPTDGAATSTSFASTSRVQGILVRLRRSAGTSSPVCRPS
jgi:hypothetical protein